MTEPPEGARREAVVVGDPQVQIGLLHATVGLLPYTLAARDSSGARAESRLPSQQPLRATESDWHPYPPCPN